MATKSTARKSRKSTATAAVKASRAAAREAWKAESAELRSKLAAWEAAGVLSDDAALMNRWVHFAGRYSERNASLIVMQDAEATEVNGYREWQRQGRQVRRGETGIRIVAYNGTASREIEPAVEGDDPEVVTWSRFKGISVFDIRQTDPIGTDAGVPFDADAAEAAELAEIEADNAAEYELAAAQA
jgi:N-terminal domain of anti-restriction factor ArdC